MYALLYGQNRKPVVYKNVTKVIKSLIRRNKAIYEIFQELDRLKDGKSFESQHGLKHAVKSAINRWSSFFVTIQPNQKIFL